MMRAEGIVYDVAQRARGMVAGGIGLMLQLARKVGLVDEIDRSLERLKVHLPYHESDHVLNIAFNVLSGGHCLEDLEGRRQDEVYLAALGAERIPDPTTAGDFCRRFSAEDVETLMSAINRCRVRVWQEQPSEFFREAIIDADGTLAPTYGKCKAGADFAYNDVFGYHPLLISLANTQEPLFLMNRSGNRPSHEGAAGYFDRAIELCRGAGFRRVLLRGDADYSQTQHLDRWDADGVRFLFGMPRSQALFDKIREIPERDWRTLIRPVKHEVKTEPRSRPARTKDEVVKQRLFKTKRTEAELVASFGYRPSACSKPYRIVVLTKNLSWLRGDEMLCDDLMHFP